MRISTIYKKEIVTALGLTAAVFLLPTSSAQAGWFDVPAAAVETVITIFLSNIFSLMGKLIAIVAQVLNYAIFVRAGGDIPIVAATWKILRDFSNMMFVVILIYIAFATIFNLGNYVFQKMILRFVVVAVLINFSLVIGGLVVDASQVLSNIFLGSIGNLGDRLGAYLTPAALLPSTVNATDLAGASMISLVFSIILLGIVLFSMAVAATFAIIRVPYIWGLLILSPLAWMSYTLPNAQSWWKRWWGLFIGWNLFLPVYLFFMYLGLLFLSKRDEVMVAVVSNSSEPLLGLGNSLTFNLFFFYVFAAMVMLGGTWAAASTTKLFGGSGFEKGLGMAKTFVKRTPWLGSRVGSLDSHEYAAKKKFEQFQKEGFQRPFLNKIYGGQEGLERARSEVASRGIYGLQKQFTGEAKKRFDEFTEEYDTGKLTVETLRDRVKDTKATTGTGYAYRKLTAEKGAWENDAVFKQSLQDLKNNPYAIQDLVKTAKGAKFDGIKDLKGIALDSSLGGPNFVPAKREILLHMSGDAKQASKFSSLEDIGKAVDILGRNSPEAKKFLDDLAKVRPDLVFKFRAQNNLFTQPAEDATGKKSTMPTLYGTVRKAINASPKDVASIPEDLWKSVEFKQALRDKLYDQNTSQKNRNSLRSNIEKVLNEQGEEEKLKILNEIAPRTDFSDRQQDRQNRAQQTTQQRRPLLYGPDGRPISGEEEENRGAGTVSYNGLPVNKANVIDLRNRYNDIEES